MTAKIGARRVCIGILLAGVGFGTAFVEPLFAVLVFLIALGSLYEFARLSERKGPVFAYPIALAGVLLYFGLTYFRVIHRFEGVLLAATVVGALAYATFTERGNYLARSSYTLLGVLYIGKLLSYFIEIRSIPTLGVLLTVYVMALVALTDVAAMATGVCIGRTPLTRLSPKKTVEGAAGGLAAAIMCGMLIGSASQLHFIWWQGALIGAVTSLAAQAGDIVESALKRDARVKDAGSAIAGHGGVLDRFDSFIFGGIAFYFALWVIARLARPDLLQLMHDAQAWSN
jgi:phosphatidate cytidylyltransferase